MIEILSDNKVFYYIPRDIMEIITSFLSNMNEVNANTWCTEENILYFNEKLKYGMLSFYLSLSNKDFTKHRSFGDDFFEREYRLCKKVTNNYIMYDSDLDWENDEF